MLVAALYLLLQLLIGICSGMTSAFAGFSLTINRTIPENVFRHFKFSRNPNGHVCSEPSPSQAAMQEWRTHWTRGTRTI